MSEIEYPTQNERLLIPDEVDPVWLYTWQEVARTLLIAATTELRAYGDSDLADRIEALLAKEPGQ